MHIMSLRNMISNGYVKSLFIFATILIIFSDSLTLDCPPVKEGGVVIVKTYFSENDSLLNMGELTIFFYKNVRLIGNCELNSRNICQNEHNDPNIKLTQTLTAGQYISTITSSTNTSWRNTSTSTLSGETWTVQLGRTDIKKTCDIQVYDIYDEPHCSINFEVDLNITCFLHVFPKALCDFKILNNTHIVKGSVIYNHEHVNDNYNTSCTFILNSMFENETLEINVTMYPNITGTGTDQAYGKTFKFNYPESQLTTKPTSFRITSTAISISSNQTNIIWSTTEKELVLIITVSSVGLLILITTAVIVIILIIKRRKENLENSNSCTYCRYTQIYRRQFLREKVTEIDNTEIFSLTLPKPKLDAYSNVAKLQLSDIQINAKRFNAGYVNCTNVADSTDKNHKNNNIHLKSGPASYTSPAKFNK